MSLIKKRDVKKHFEARRRKSRFPTQPAVKPSSTGLPVAGPAQSEVNAVAFIDDFSREHSSPDGALPAPVIPDPGGYGQAPVVVRVPKS
jgi:hypothetical protein